AEENPADPEFRKQLAQIHNGLGLLLWEVGGAAEAEAEYRQALALFQRLADDHPEVPEYRAGLAFALTNLGDVPRWLGRGGRAGLAGVAGSGISAAERPAEADAAMSLLRKALAMGYRNGNAFRTEDALDPLRDRPDFQLLLMDLAMPEEPFGPGPSSP